MNYYLDITLLPDAETNLGFLWEKVYQQIHLLLVEHKVGEKDSAIGLSFPKYGSKDFPLGDKLRLLAKNEQGLVNLNVNHWLGRLADYVHVKVIKPVPSDVSRFVYFKRKQFKSPNKLRKNLDSRAEAIAQKNGFDIAEVKKRLLASIDSFDQESKLPFINLRSLSTDKLMSPDQRRKFLLFIEQQPAKSPIGKSEVFTCHGLSRRKEEEQTAVPWFEG